MQASKPFFKSLLALSFVSSSLVASQALAIVLNFSIVKSESIDPDTGESKFEYDNPSKTVDMSFLKNAVSLKYVKANGVSKEVKIHVDPMASMMYIPANEADRAFILNNLGQSGLLVMSSYLKQIGTQDQSEVALYLNNTHKPGLINNDFELHNVTIFMGSDSVGLLKIIGDSYLQTRAMHALLKTQKLTAQQEPVFSCSSIY